VPLRVHRELILSYYRAEELISSGGGKHLASYQSQNRATIASDEPDFLSAFVRAHRRPFCSVSLKSQNLYWPQINVD